MPPPTRTGFTWPKGKKAALSISFDDARPSQIDRGVPILDRHGVRATFFVTLIAMEKRLADWKAAAKTGHEIANHTVMHACSRNFGSRSYRGLEHYTIEEMEAELLEANRVIQEWTGIVPKSFAYPCGQQYVGFGVGTRSYAPLVAKHFVVGRSYRDEFFNMPELCDLSRLSGTESDSLEFDELWSRIAPPLDAGAWVILAGHDVGDNCYQSVVAEALDELCKRCLDPKRGIWIDTVGTIGEYVRRADPV